MILSILVMAQKLLFLINLLKCSEHKINKTLASKKNPDFIFDLRFKYVSEPSSDNAVKIVKMKNMIQIFLPLDKPL